MADLNALMIFAKVVEARSLSAAARQLGMPLSTLSRRIAELENAMGERLFVRSSRSLTLTEAGTRIIRHARAAADIGDAVNALTSRDQSALSGVLRLSAPPSISDTVLAPLVAAFRLSKPEIDVKVFISSRITDGMAQDADLEIKIGPRRDSALVTHRLLSYRHRLVASPAYLAGAKPIIHPKDLHDHPLLAFAFPGAENNWTLNEVGGRGREVLRFRPHISIADYAGLISVMLGGGGVGDLPPVVQPELLREGQLVEVLPNWDLPMFDLALAHERASHPSPIVQAFIDFAASSVPERFPYLV